MLSTSEFSSIKPCLTAYSRYEGYCVRESIHPFPIAAPRRGIFKSESRMASAKTAVKERDICMDACAYQSTGCIVQHSFHRPSTSFERVSAHNQ